MILLTEVAEIEEFYRLRFLFEENGILIYLGNQESARSFGAFHPVGRYAIYVILDEQLEDAQKLLFDETHVVENKVDVHEYYRHLEQTKTLTNWKILISLLLVCIGLIGLLALFFL